MSLHKWSIQPIPPRLPIHRYAATLARKLAEHQHQPPPSSPGARVLLVAAGERAAAQALRVLAEAVRRGERSLGFSAIASVQIVREDPFGGRVARGELRDAGAADAVAAVPLPGLAGKQRRRCVEGNREDGGEKDDDDHEASYGYDELIERRRQRALDAPLAQRRRDPSARLPPRAVLDASRKAAAAAEEEGGGQQRLPSSQSNGEPERDDIFCFYVWGVPHDLSPEQDDDREEEGLEERRGGGASAPSLAAASTTPPLALARRVDRAVSRRGAAVVDGALGPAAVRAARAVALASEWGEDYSGGLGFHVSAFAAQADDDGDAPAAAAASGRPRPLLRLLRFTVVPVPASWWH